MTPSTDHVSGSASPAPALIAGLVVLALGAVAFSPLGDAIGSAFREGWLAVFLDAQLFRVLCF